MWKRTCVRESVSLCNKKRVTGDNSDKKHELRKDL